MGNVPTIGYPVSKIDLQNPLQSGIGSNCVGYQYNKISDTVCVCASGYTGVVISSKTPSKTFVPVGCSLISGNQTFTIPTLIIPNLTNSSIGLYSTTSFSVNGTTPTVVTNALVNNNSADYFNIIKNTSGGNLYQCFVNIGYIDTSMFFTTSSSVSFTLGTTTSSTNYIVGLVFMSSANIFNFPKQIIPSNSTFTIDTKTSGYSWPYNFNDGKIYNVYVTIISSSDLSGISINNLNFSFNGPVCADSVGYKNNFGYNGACVCDANFTSSGNANTVISSVGGAGISATQQSIGTSGNIVTTANAGSGYLGYSYYSQNGSVVYYFNNTTSPLQLTLSGCTPDPSLCPPGKYCPTNLSSATPCPTGSYCKINSTAPTICSSGYYCPYGSGTQLQCPQGFYCPQGTGSPIACSSGYYCPQGTGSQIPCAPGYISTSTGASICSPCAPGSFTSTSGNTTCTTSSSGYYISQYASSSMTPCPIGTYSTTVGATGLSNCLVCQSGYYCPNTGMTGGLVCPAGSYCSSGSSNPTNCPQGYYCPQQSTGGFNNNCPSGYYCPTGTSISTQNICPAGSYCPQNSFNSTLCPPGKFNANTQGKSISDCLDCPAGSFTSLSSAGNIGCQGPIAGFITSSSGTPQNNTTYTNIYNYYSSTGVIPTPATITYSSSTSASQAGGFSKGSFFTNNLYTGKSSVQKEVFFVGSLNNAYAFTASQAAQVASDFGGTVATYSQLNDTWTNDGADWCATAWVTGSASNVNSTSVTNAYYPISVTTTSGCSASPGLISYTPSNGKAGVHVYGIKPLQSDALPTPTTSLGISAYALQPFVTGGRWSRNFASSQISCPMGYYQDTAQQSSCKLCPAGSSCASKGTITPAQCSAGTYSTGGSSSCTACADGTYTASPGSSSCGACSAGYYSDSTTNHTYQQKCPINTYCQNGIKYACSAGTYSNSGQTSCDLVYIQNGKLNGRCIWDGESWGTVDTACKNAFGYQASTTNSNDGRVNDAACWAGNYHRYLCNVGSYYRTNNQSGTIFGSSSNGADPTSVLPAGWQTYLY
jgi:Extracellular link domain/Tyrosine-protein kinase ephrin type A/B receptor-like